jgi:primosomal protein N' (replication factor Y)
LLAETISLGKRGIVLVPEVALTSQIINHFASRFPGKVAVWHGELSAGEQFDEWQRIKEGEFDIVIGTRSAIFTPLPNLGIVIVDEEQEQTYKQEKKFPRYHARDVALKLAEQMNAVVVLGSATPDVASYYRGQIGEYRLLEISGGISPRVEIVDLRKELKEGNRSIFSRQLRKSIEEVLKRGEQAILFLNRRGSASFVQCRDCGFVARCPNCDIPLTYHSGETRVVREPPLLVCHQCNYRTSVPKRCPECSSKRIKFLGIGTQKVEEEAAKAFPRARLLRWDRDVVRGKRSYEEILRRFSAYEADILIGTQVIAKDVDLSQVALAGVLLADIGLNLPDFRSSERIFQLLTKLTKRARKTIVQTYVPEHYAVVAAAKGDFKSFYRQGIAFRRSLNNPPFSHLTRLLFTHTDAIRCQEEAERVALFLKDEKERSGSDADIIGPSPAYFRKIRDKYRWQIFTRSSDPQSLLCKVPTSPNLTVDADPATVL